MTLMKWRAAALVSVWAAGCVPEIRVVLDSAADAATDLSTSEMSEVPLKLDTPDVADATTAVDVSIGVDRPDVSECPAPLVRCGSRCVDVSVEVSDCGACGNHCAALPNVVAGNVRCASSACVIDATACAAGWARCSADTSRGCETSLAATDHCGACMTRCAGGTPVCASSGGSYACSSGCMPSSPTLCAGNCIDTRTNTQHCGGCGIVCPGGDKVMANCVEAVCRRDCIAGFQACAGACVAGVCGSEQPSCSATGTPGCGLISVEGGTFTIGNDTICASGAVSPGCAIYSAPAVAAVRVSTFSIDSHEVTVARFRAFWSARAADIERIRSRPIAYPGVVFVPWGEAAGAPVSTAAFPSCNWSDVADRREAHPINCLTWWAAQEFCVWDGGRLPTEAEWEFTARGRPVPASGLIAARVFPWGNQTPASGAELASCDRALIAPCPGEDGASTRRVGRFAATAGVYDLAGNLAEWVADAFVPVAHRVGCWPTRIDPVCTSTAELRLIAGGAWVNPEVNTRSASRVGFSPSLPLNSVGFRCARSL
jgi:formylglycine-generating enzyme